MRLVPLLVPSYLGMTTAQWVFSRSLLCIRRAGGAVASAEARRHIVPRWEAQPHRRARRVSGGAAVADRGPAFLPAALVEPQTVWRSFTPAAPHSGTLQRAFPG